MSIGQRLCILLLGAMVLGVVCSCASLPGIGTASRDGTEGLPL
jgi:hypothetical protein